MLWWTISKCLHANNVHLCCMSKDMQGNIFWHVFSCCMCECFFWHKARRIFYKPFNFFVASPWHWVFQHITRLGVRCGSCIKIFPFTLTKCGDILGSGFGEGDVLEHMKRVHAIMHPLQTTQVLVKEVHNNFPTSYHYIIMKLLQKCKFLFKPQKSEKINKCYVLKKSFFVTCWWEIKSSFGCHLFIRYVGLKITLMFLYINYQYMVKIIC